MRSDIHLAVSTIPLKEGQPVAVVCQKILARAHFPFLVEGDIRGITVDKLGSCRKCVGAVLETVDAQAGAVFIYGAVEQKEVAEHED